MTDRTCSIDGCDKPHFAGGWCSGHWQRNRRYGDPLGGGPMRQPPRECSVQDCGERAIAKELCRTHYYRLKRWGDVRADLPITPHPQRPRNNKTCSVGDCGAKYYAKDYCLRHYQRWKDYGDPEAPLRRARNGQSTKRWLNHDGYVLIRLRGKTIQEHRQVMEEKLGRPLAEGETVHHMNGVRDDNRPENLELWVSTRSGQRVADLVAFVVERYPAEVEAALGRRCAR